MISPLVLAEVPRVRTCPRDVMETTRRFAFFTRFSVPAIASRTYTKSIHQRISPIRHQSPSPDTETKGA
jgi:hypothetical protein